LAPHPWRIALSAARSFKLHGFRNIVFLDDHGGYRKNLHIVGRTVDAINKAIVRR
jgi:creatinine amidohydrolase